MLFAPTGSLQELSLDNGWGVEFLELSGRFDKLAKRLRQSGKAGAWGKPGAEQ